MPGATADRITGKIYAQKVFLDHLEEMAREYKADPAAFKSKYESTAQTRMQNLRMLREKFDSYHAFLVDNYVKVKDNDYFKKNYFSSTVEFYVQVVSALDSLVEKPDLSALSSTRLDLSAEPETSHKVCSGVRTLPEITLPRFSGDLNQWRSFRDLFTSLIIDNSDLSDVDRNHYLRTSLSGDALLVVSSLPLSADAFKTSWDMLIDRFDNPRVLISAQIDRLLSLPVISTASSAGLNSLINSLSDVVNNLKTLDVHIEGWHYFMVRLVLRSVDPRTRESWEMKMGASKEYPKFADLIAFISSRARALETLEQSVERSSASDRVSSGSKPSPNLSRPIKKSLSANVSRFECSYCSEKHYIVNCPKFLSLPLDSRREFATQKRLCYNCLGPHPVKSCTNQGRCRQCNYNHHTLLHKTAEDGSSSSVVHKYSSVLLGTCCANIITTFGNSYTVRILVDPGSEFSFIKENLVKVIGLTRHHSSFEVTGINGGKSGKTRGSVQIKLTSIYNNFDFVQLYCNILPELNIILPSFESNKISEFKHLELADPSYNVPSPIDILLGADVYGKILTTGICRISDDHPIAIQTIFGWIILGPVDNSIKFIKSFHVSTQQQNETLMNLLSKFWIQEEVPVSDSVQLNPDELKCEEHFKRTHSRDENGRYIVRLPFKLNPNLLGDSESVASHCLRRMINKLNRQTQFGQLYRQFLSEYLDMGHMVQAPPCSDNSQTSYYLPHHGVLRESSTTTKLRVVFNGSQKSSSGYSLNDLLHTGANLQINIIDVLMWVRLHRYIFITDITKMFRQIKVHPDDWDYQRILWINQSSDVIPFNLTTVTYGTKPAPFLSIRTLLQLVEDEGSRFKRAVPCIVNGRYVDDICGGADSVQELGLISKDLIGLCTAGGFPLAKWQSNSEDFLRIGEFECSQDVLHSFEESSCKVLGISWRPNLDRFEFTTQLSQKSIITKRAILSEVSQLFDPLGFLSPVIICAKILLQELWLTKLGWDDILTPRLQHRWLMLRKELTNLSSITVPRWLNLSPASGSVQIHGFSDASCLAMAAVVYLRVISSTGSVSVSFVCSKTKVAPLKRMSVPRLELTAAAILSKLVVYVVNVLKLSHVPIYLWTDSSVALTWIHGHPSRWKDFVSNRVSLIQSSVPEAQWLFISGKQNPADCASRGLSAQQLKSHHLWWSGPSWLCQPETRWPKSTTSAAVSEANLEERPGLILTTVTKASQIWDLVNRYSDLTRLLRITAVCQRSCDRFRGIPQSSLTTPLYPEDLEKARIFWVRAIQSAFFRHELEIVSSGGKLSKSHSMSKLTPFIDRAGILRVGGRLNHSSLDFDNKHPAIIPRDSAFTALLISDAHRKTLHGGTQITLSYLRTAYWIIGGRYPVRTFILKCVRCARYRNIRAQQLMGQLPEKRVNPARPFSVVGIDYAGPVILKTWRGRGAKTYKAWMAVFVCFTTSAVHLEAVTDYSTDAFLAAFRRFTSRRGICNSIYSDCGTNFVGADIELRKFFKQGSVESNTIVKSMSDDGIKWHFNPPSAPHFGGKWEAAVKSVKFHLKRTVAETVLTYEELSTLLAQIESVLNSRPLCALTEDPDDISVLTPGHFLIGEALQIIPEPCLSAVPISRLSRWQLIQQKLQYFWNKWSRECLQQHLARSKWHHPSNTIKVNSIVLITDERLPPSRWPLGRVTAIHPGADGLVRVVTLRTATSTFTRPISKLAVLPVDQHGDQHQDIINRSVGKIDTVPASSSIGQKQIAVQSSDRRSPRLALN